MQKSKEETKRGIYMTIFSIIIILLVSSMVSAGWLDWLKKITGQAATEPVDINITVGVPEIILVYNTTHLTYLATPGALNEGPLATNVTINFSVYSPSGAGNLNHTTSLVNFSKADTSETTRENSSCSEDASAGDYANYTCFIQMWWWDINGTWNITAYIEDNESNAVQNTSTVFELGLTTGLSIGPGNLTWTAFAAGSTNKTATGPLLLNNTGNDIIEAGDIDMNATDLRGETTNTEALWAGNFSISWQTGSDAECGASTSTSMVDSTYTAIAGANLSKGNYTINDNNQGQEQLYFCIREVGTLSTQSYSTLNESSWTIQIT